MNFTSDNVHGILPEVLDAISNANNNTANAYSDDTYTSMVQQKLSDIFETDVRVYLMATGTGANAVAMSAIAKKYGVICCNKSSHIYQDETGAPEALMGGARLMPISENLNSKITATDLQTFFSNEWLGGKHHMQASGVSISNLSEHGVAYHRDEVQSISKICKEKNLYLHMDGARFSNAIVGMKESPANITWRAGVDILSFGLTKLGALAAEMIVVFNKDLNADMKFLHKRGSQLLSKSRFVSVQILAMLNNNLWLDTAKNSNDKASALAIGAKNKGYKIIQPVNGNQVFIEIPEAKRTALFNMGFQFYVFTSLGKNACRFVTAYNTKDTDIQKLLRAL